MVVAVDADLQDGRVGEALERGQALAQGGEVLEHLSRQPMRVGGQLVHRLPQRLSDPVQAGTNLLLPPEDVGQPDGLRPQRRSQRGRGQRPVQAAREKPQRVGLLRVRRCQRLRERGIGGAVGLGTTARRRVVLVQARLHRRPGIALGRKELVKRGQGRGLVSLNLVDEEARQPWRFAEVGLLGEVARELQLGVRTWLEPAEDLEEGPLLQHPRGVALLDAHGLHRADGIGQELRQEGGGAEPEAAAPARQRAPGAHLLHQGGAEGRIVEGVGQRAPAGRASRQGHEVCLGVAHLEVHTEQGERPSAARHLDVIHGRHGRDPP